MFTPSEKTKNLKQSGIRAASTRCAAMNGINLGQGLCDLPTPDNIKQGAYDAIRENKSLYSACEGILPLRQAISKKLLSFNKIKADPETEVIVTHGSTGAFVCAINTLFNPGDEVILFEPFYGYHKNLLNMHGIATRSVTINLDNLQFSIDELAEAINSKTRGIVICTPCNPCGKVFTRDELQAIGELVQKHNLYVITDEIYEYITYPGYEHISPASLSAFENKTITISGFSKTFNMTGWRLGYAAGPKDIIAKMALVQDLLYVCPATPLQHAALQAFEIDDSYYHNMQKTYLNKKDLVVSALQNLGFKVTVPQGAYYLMADFSALKFADDQAAADFILEKAKVATVPGRSFFANPEHGKHFLRLCFALDETKLDLAMTQMQAIKAK